MADVGEDHGGLDALVARNRQLVNERRYEAAFDSCQDLIDRYGCDDDKYVVHLVAEAMVQQCWCLRRSGEMIRLVEAVNLLNDRFGDASDPWLSRCAARGLFEQICGSLRSGDPHAALSGAETLISRFEGAHSAEVRDGFAELLLWSASQLAWFSQPWRQLLTVPMLMLSPLSDRAASARSWLATRAHAEPLASRAFVPMVLLNQSAEVRNRRARLEMALRIYDLLITRYDGAPDPALHRFAVGAKLNLGPVYVILGRAVPARKACREMFALSPAELATIIDRAQPHPDGGYGITDTLASIISAASSPSESSNGTDARAQTILDSTVVRRAYKRFQRMLD